MSTLIPNVPDSRLVDEAGYPSQEFRIFFEELINSITLIKTTDKLTTVGGSATEKFSIPGTLTTDLVTAQIISSGVGSIHVERSITLSNEVEVVFSANPTASTVVSILVIRPNVPNRFI